MMSSAKHRFFATGKALALGAVTMLCALSVQAGTERMDPPSTQRAVVVRYADLNLKTPEGNQALYARLSAAARRACGGEPGIHELHQRQVYKACYDAALAKAVTRVGSEQLQALHAEHTANRSVG